MSKDTWAGMIIRYVDGNENRLAFQRAEDESQAVARVEEALKANMLILELEDRVRLIPFHQIRSIEIKPKAKVLPRYAVRDVHIVE